MGPLKVDFIIGKMNAGGAQRVIANLTNYLAVKDCKIRVITFRDGDAYNLDPRIERIRFDNTRLFRWTIVSCFFSLLNYYFKKTNRPDILSVHVGEMGYPTIPIARLYRIRIIVSEHFNHYLQRRKLKRRMLWKYFYGHAHDITVLTNKDTAFFKRFNPNVHVMENPCSFEISDVNESNREHAIIAVGNLNRFHQKGFDTLLKIAKEVLPRFPKWRIRIIGEGNKGLEYLQELALKYQIDNQVDFMGYRSDVKKIMSASEIYILPSRGEGLPMVLLEALSQRMACIAFDCKTGPSEIIQDNQNGFLIEDQNITLMSEKLMELMENRALRRKFQKNAPVILKNYSIENVGNKWIKLFHNSL